MPMMNRDEKANILLVDDQPNNLLALEATLEGLGQNLVKARSGPEALKWLLNHQFAVILLDVLMPGMDGFETELIRQREKTQRTPIDRKSTRLNSSHQIISYAVFCLKKKKKKNTTLSRSTNGRS